MTTTAIPLPSTLRQDRSTNTRRCVMALAVIPFAFGPLAACPAPEGAVEPSSTSAVHGALSANARGALSADGQGSLSTDAPISSATRAELFVIGDDGSLVLMNSAKINDKGAFIVRTNPTSGPMIINVVDDDGVIVGEALVARGPSDGAGVWSPPVSTQSTLEARVFQAMLHNDVDADDVDVADLRMRIDADVAAAVRAARAAGWSDGRVDSDGVEGNTSVAVAVDIIAAAAVGALRIRTEAWRAQGVSPGLAVEARTAAVMALNARDPDARVRDDVDASFFTELSSIDDALGIDAEQSARIEREASAAARAVLASCRPLDGAVATALVGATARIEARADLAALVALAGVAAERSHRLSARR